MTTILTRSAVVTTWKSGVVWFRNSGLPFIKGGFGSSHVWYHFGDRKVMSQAKQILPWKLTCPLKKYSSGWNTSLSFWSCPFFQVPAVSFLGYLQSWTSWNLWAIPNERVVSLVFSKKITNISGSVSVKVSWGPFSNQTGDSSQTRNRSLCSPPKQHCDTQDVFFPKIMSSIFFHFEGTTATKRSLQFTRPASAFHEGKRTCNVTCSTWSNGTVKRATERSPRGCCMGNRGSLLPFVFCSSICCIGKPRFCIKFN